LAGIGTKLSSPGNQNQIRVGVFRAGPGTNTHLFGYDGPFQTSIDVNFGTAITQLANRGLVPNDIYYTVDINDYLSGNLNYGYEVLVTANGSPAGWFAGGGGGGTRIGNGTGGVGGNGGGTNGTNSNTQATAAPANTGGGGGGGGHSDITANQVGGNGGSGIVIVRYYIGTPTWSSQNAAIATVSNGVVTGIAPGGSTSIDYTIASVGGCPSTTVTVPINVIGGQRIAPLGPQCSGTQLNFEALPNPSVLGTTISWTVTTPLPTGLTASTLSGNTNLFSSTFTNEGNFTPTITISQTIGTLTCTRNFTPTIIALPTVSLNCTNFCSGIPIDIIATPSPAGTYTYSWTSLPGGVINPGNTVNTSTAGTYTVIVTETATGCQSAATSCTIAVQNPPSINAISPP
jgi:hypothetical protein